MTTQARRVLEDCKFALDELRQALEGGRGRAAREEWNRARRDPDSELARTRRVRWVALLTLLRAVGHVLAKVDKEHADPQMQAAIDEAWDQLRELKPAIFWQFIERERNAVVKEYEFAVGEVVLHLGEGRELEFWPGRPITLPTEITPSYPILSGYFEGQEQADVAAIAIKFWEDYLDTIDRNAELRKSQTP